MDRWTGEFALVNGRDYRLPLLDAAWVLERFPPALSAVPFHRTKLAWSSGD
jgi:hypothetical protein